MPIDVTEPVNLSRSILTCNIFYFLFAASKACLLPFLTIYLRLLGLSATMTGIIIGAKTLSSLIFAPLWAKCSIKCHMRRVVLMAAIFMMAATYLSLTLVPSVNQNINSCRDVSDKEEIPASLISNLKADKIKTTVATPTSIHSTVQVTESVTILDMNQTNSTIMPSTKPQSSPHPIRHTSPVPEDETIKNVKNVLGKLSLPVDKIMNMSRTELFELIQGILKDEEQRQFVESLLSEEDLEAVIAFLEKEQRREKRDISSSLDNIKVSILQSLSHFKKKIKDSKNQIFVIVLVILLVGEIFCSPVEKIADDSWFEFLESIDDMEKYGKHRIWSSFAFILIPVIVAAVVDNTDCLFGLHVHPFMFHFYMFGGFLGLTFLMGFFYPMSPSEKVRYKSKIVKGMSMTCCTCVGLLYIITLLIMGLVYAVYNNFLFWMIQDLHGTEIIMATCIMIASMAELPMLFFSNLLVRKLGNGGTICLSLVCLSLRTLYYSYLWTPWAVLPAEVFHAFTHTAMWFAVLSNPAFQMNPTVDRGIRSILSSVYFGLGFGIGSFLSGVLYDQYGLGILFRGCSILAIAWCPVFFLMQKCCNVPNENQIQYTKLLQSDDQSEDDLEDDWLEHALRDR